MAILEEDQLAEVYFEHAQEYSIAGSIYKGRVTRVLPGMQSAFVDIGLERDAFLYVSDFLEDTDAFDKLDAGVEGGVVPIYKESVPPQGRVFSPLQAAPTISAPVAQSPQVAAGAPLETPGHRRRGRRRSRRRFGDRGFPQAKYANLPEVPSRRSEGPSPAPVVEGGSGSMVLPGESLAKYRHLTPPAPEDPRVHEPSAEELEKPEETNLNGEPAAGVQLGPQLEEAQQEQPSHPGDDTVSASELTPEITEPVASRFEQVPAAPLGAESAAEAVWEDGPSVSSAEQPQPEGPAAAAAAEESTSQPPGRHFSGGSFRGGGPTGNCRRRTG